MNIGGVAGGIIYQWIIYQNVGEPEGLRRRNPSKGVPEPCLDGPSQLLMYGPSQLVMSEFAVATVNVRV